MSRRFSGIGSAQVGKGGNFFKPGTYLVQIKSCLFKVSRKRDDLYIIEATICKALASGEGSNMENSSASQVLNLTKHDAAMGNVKGFLCALLNCKEEDLSDAEWEAAAELSCSDEQPFAGNYALVEVREVKTKAGGDFTLHQWQHCPEADALAALAA